MTERIWAGRAAVRFDCCSSVVIVDVVVRCVCGLGGGCILFVFFVLVSLTGINSEWLGLGNILTSLLGTKNIPHTVSVLTLGNTVVL